MIWPADISIVKEWIVRRGQPHEASTRSSRTWKEGSQAPLSERSSMGGSVSQTNGERKKKKGTDKDTDDSEGVLSLSLFFMGRGRNRNSSR